MVLAEAKVSTNVMVLADARSWSTRRSYTSTSSVLPDLLPICQFFVQQISLFFAVDFVCIVLCAAVIELNKRLPSNQSPWPNHSCTAGMVFDEMSLTW